jgi:manganese transport protein
LLILSQVILSFQLPFAIVPLIMFTSSKKKMQAMVAPIWLTITAIVIAAIIILLNIKLISDIIK